MKRAGAGSENTMLKNGGNIVADASSLIYLAKTGMLPTYCDFKQLLLPQSIFYELICNNHLKYYEEKLLYFKLLASNKLKVIRTNKKPGQKSIYQPLDQTDAALIQLYFSQQAQGVLSDDRDVCSYCKQHNIFYINTPMALFSLLVNQAITAEVFNDSLNRVYTIGRYSRAVREHMAKLMAAHC